MPKSISFNPAVTFYPRSSLKKKIKKPERNEQVKYIVDDLFFDLEKLFYF
jgi:hypothetical protein